jgi:DNA (cytosine-5)-methyltransferase 1
MGLYRAGFLPVGFDIVKQPRYPFDFVLQDALTVKLDAFDAVWASPPCQEYSLASRAQRNAGKVYPDLIAPTRELLRASGKPWVIENVPGAPVDAHFVICGCQVGLPLRRVRWFETSWEPFEFRPPHLHEGPVVSVVGHGTPTWVRERLGYDPTTADYRAAMGIDWMSRDELSQAIPPAYSLYVGHALLAHMAATAPAAGLAGAQATRRACVRSAGGSGGVA